MRPRPSQESSMKGHSNWDSVRNALMDEDEDDAVEVSFTAPWTVVAVTIKPGTV